MDEKNYYKSLDYQGLTFKSSERKTVTNRYLLNEIESLYQHDDNDNENEKDHHHYHHSTQSHEQKSNISSSSTTIPHLSYKISDTEIFDDILYLINMYMEHQNGFSPNDKNRVRKFFKSFVPIFFNVNADFILENKNSNGDNQSLENNKTNSNKMDEDEDNDEDGDDHSTNTPTSSYSEDNLSEDQQQRQKKHQKSKQVKSRSSSRLKHIDQTTDSFNTKENSSDDKLLDDKITKNDDDDSKEIVESVDNEMKVIEHHKSNNLAPTSSPILESNSTNQLSSESKDLATIEIMDTASAMTTPKFCYRIMNHLYGNNYFYCFLRLFEVINR